ncbi:MULTISPECIES: hypothetical protein [unclassified Sphingomonas]|uniref:hypothetical protein n=1 Tax=unclassified Sphingomonas TaxID=196159 RepID=UPI002150E87C|nr:MULTISPECIES: hypothetical protein [unclassified Sphingomonas]MCR5872281.1 hypothetical protein [Sphingomonas sp. J344]UUX99419.1 hypothetical protein LRS08_18570 [Sphingomonas sp. J315]
MTITSTMPAHQIASVLARYCNDHDIPLSRFGRQAVGDPRLIHDVQGGRTLRPATVARINRALAREGRA